MRQQETKGLLAVVRRRRRARRLFVALSEAYRARVWQKLRSKLLSSHPSTHSSLPGNTGGDADATPGQDANFLSTFAEGGLSRPPSHELDEIFEVVKLGYAASHHLARGSMPYRELVWLRLQERLRTTRRTDHYLSPTQAAAVRSPSLGGQASGQLLGIGGVLRSLLSRVWQPLAGGAMTRQRALAAATTAMVAAVAALMLVTNGSSALGLVTQFFDVIRQRGNVLEVNQPLSLDAEELARLHVPTTVQPTSMSPQEAAATMGLPIAPPRYLPPGFQPVHQAYYMDESGPQTSGMYVLKYSRSGAVSQADAREVPTVIVRYEADDKLLIAPSESTSYVAVGGMGECAYVKSSEESLHCVKDGVAITVNYLGGEGSRLEEMVRIAASIGEAQDNHCYDLRAAQETCGQVRHWTPRLQVGYYVPDSLPVQLGVEA
ncbi:MAG: hypothetical protein ACE5IZ_00780 [Dehalococcoidia bacterium]